MRRVDWVPLLTRHFVDDFASHIRLYRKSKDRLRSELSKEPPPPTPLDTEDIDQKLEGHFFDLELDMEKTYCRDLVSTSTKYENAYLHDVADLLMYLLVPPEDFRCRPMRFVLREALVKRVLLPVIEMFSDPDYLNQTIIWLLSEVPMNVDDYLCIVSASSSLDELACMKHAVQQQMQHQRAKDTGGQDDSAVKQRLSSLSFVQNIIEQRLKQVKQAKGGQLVSPISESVSERPALRELPLSFVLTNSLALTYFIDYLQTVDGQGYIDLYLAIEGFKVSAEHQLADAHLHLVTRGEAIDPQVLDNIREAAASLFAQYLAQGAAVLVRLDEPLVRSLQQKIDKEKPSDNWFDQVQTKVIDVLEKDVRFFPAFKTHPLYFRMLAELSMTEQNCVNQRDQMEQDCAFNNDGSVGVGVDVNEVPGVDSTAAAEAIAHSPNIFKSNSSQRLAAYIANIGIGRETNRSFALYNIRAVRETLDGTTLGQWNIMRRYSDFHSLNSIVESRFPALSRLPFPGKRTFNNLNQDFLEKRKRALNNYMNALLHPAVIGDNPGLEHIVVDFVCSKDFTGNRGPLTKRVMSSFVNPISKGVRAFGDAVTAVPESVFDGVLKVGEGVGKVTKSIIGTSSAADEPHLSSPFEGRVGAELSSDNPGDAEAIPLRIMLLFMDEIFGLRQRNQWFRRQMVAFVRQFVHAALGTSINRKIVDFVSWLTSAEQVAEYLKALRDAIWPNGHLAESLPPRAANLQQRARVVAKVKMLTMLPDELRLFVGNETSREGVELVFDALQHAHLNRRLVYVLLERLLVTIFPTNRFDHILPRLHSKSPRCQQQM